MTLDHLQSDTHVLIELSELYQEWRADHGYQMTEDAAAKFGVESIEECDALLSAFYRAELATLAASDFARGLAVTLGDERLAFSQFPVARACLEACAVSRWLTDPALDNAARIARLTEVVRRDNSEGAKLAKTSDLADARDYFDGRIDSLGEVAVKLGVTANRNRKGQVTSYGTALNASELASQQLGGIHEFRLWSGITHGVSWALWRAGLNAKATPEPLFPTPIVEICRDPEAEEPLVMATLRCFMAAAIDTVSVMGWDGEAFFSRVTEICDRHKIDVVTWQGHDDNGGDPCQ